MPKPSLCLNMIVKNEAARIERCLRSVLPFVKSVCVLDTGSTDHTVEMIEAMCTAFDVCCHVGRGDFKDFSQARNEAFKLAQDVNGKDRMPWVQFALLMDADMEFVVDAPSVLHKLNANALSYDMIQKGGHVSYHNRRVVNLEWGTPPYVGVTHEYVDVPTAGLIEGARFIDHADGANRADKYVRDAQLLEEALKTDPNNGRYLYYLGNTYRDWGGTDKTVLPYAMDAYDKRIKLGGWDEETHSAMMHLAGVRKDLGHPAGYVSRMIDAYNFRPSRAEPLYDLAKYYREKGDPAASLLFSKQGMKVPRPNDLLFVNDFVYEHGLRFEYSVCGFYDEKERNSAFQVTDDLALDPTCPENERQASRRNLYWYTKPLRDYCPSFRDSKVTIPLPDGYTGMNPSVEVCNGHILCNIRAVNYKIDEHGRYMIGPKECNDAPIDTRNFVCKMDGDFNVEKIREIIWDRPLPKFPQVTGLEDVRLYRYRGHLYFSACVREQASNGTCQQYRGQLVHDIDDKYMLAKNVSPISGENAIEKNWMPISERDHEFMYRLDRVVYTNTEQQPMEVKHPTKLHVGDISGSSQLIPFRHGWIAVTHEAATGPDDKRTYWHRFAWFNIDGELRRLSLPFVFCAKQIEFCAGLAYHPNNEDLIISFGVRDEEAHLAKVNIEEVAQMVWKFHEN